MRLLYSAITLTAIDKDQASPRQSEQLASYLGPMMIAMLMLLLPRFLAEGQLSA